MRHSRRDVHNICHQTRYEWSKQINENEEQLRDQMHTLGIKWYLAGDTDWSARRFRYRFRNGAYRRECTGRSCAERRKIYFSYNSHYRFPSHDRTSFKYSQGRNPSAVHTILGNPRPYIIRRFAKFFPAVRRAASAENTHDSFARVYFLLWKDGKRVPLEK